MKKIVFLVPYPPGESPSQRFRFEQYKNLLERNGFEPIFRSFFSQSAWQILYQGKRGYIVLHTLLGFVRRTCHLLDCIDASRVFIHREATPVGPPIFEWLIGIILQKKMIYDFDDAIWLTDKQAESSLFRLMKWRKKVKKVCQWSYKISCGNNFLLQFASRYNSSVFLIPTTIDTDTLHNPSLYTVEKNNREVVIGWTGSHSTLKYLIEIEPILQRIEKDFPAVRFVMIADQPPSVKLSRLFFTRWNLSTEIPDLLKLDIGIMPLPDDEWSKGKCGFKALQYMALKIPAVVSPVGVNATIVDHGEVGFVPAGPMDWYQCLADLIENKTLRTEMGERGRKKVMQYYSVKSNEKAFLALFE